MPRTKRKLHLNRQNKKFLGVCAGIADFLDVEAWVVRLVVVALLFMGVWVVVPAYFILYFLLNEKSGALKEDVMSNSTVKHFKNVDYKKRLYRNVQDGKLLGVCAGLADYFEIDVTVVRLLTVFSFFIGGPIPWIAYFAAAFILDKKPVRPITEAADGAAEGRPAQEQNVEDRIISKRKGIKNCVRKFSRLQDRLERIEAYVTSSQFKLHSEFKQIS